MVKWTDVWLEKLDMNQVKIKLWAEKKNSEYAVCKLCLSELKYSLVGFQALFQHSSKPKHKSVSDIRFSNTARHFYIDSKTNSTGEKKIVTLEYSTNDKISAAEAMWLFKVAENDLALRHCDNTSVLFQRMFPDSKICQGFTMSRQKASYIFQDGLGPLLEKRLCTSITSSPAAFTLMFDETTTTQQRKQMDLLCRFWSEEENQVVTKYLTSFFFGRATAEDVKKMLASLFHNKKYNLPWGRLFNISTDGPNINKAIWRLLNEELCSNDFNGLLPFISCTLHTVHNAFRKAIMVLGEDAEQLAFDLHAWFKNAPCKIEDFKKLAESIFIEDESLFLRFVNTRWLTLSATLEKVLLRWEDTKKYFLEYIPKQKEYKKTLTNNKRFVRIQKSLKENENELLVSIKFLIGIAPLFEKYLMIFQDEGPLIHILFYKMKDLLISLMKRFLKPSAVDKKLTKDLLKIDSSDSTIHLEINKMDFGEEAKNQVKKLSCEKKRYICLEQMRDGYIAIVKHLQKKLPLDSQLLKDLTCLSPQMRSKPWTVNAIGRIAAMMPHIVNEREVSFVKDEWKLYQADNVSEDWYLDSNTNKLKRVDHYWAKVFQSNTECGKTKYGFLHKVVKSCLTLQNGNASVERSLSDNKNTLISERVKLNDETLMALRISKEYARSCQGAHNVDTLAKDVVQAVQNAHRIYKVRKTEEEEEKRFKKIHEEELICKKKQHQEMLQKIEKSKINLDQKEQNLEKDEKNADMEFELAQRMLDEATKSMQSAINKEDMIGIKLAHEMVNSAKRNFTNAKAHSNEQKKLRVNIGLKRKSEMQRLINGFKKSK